MTEGNDIPQKKMSLKEASPESSWRQRKIKHPLIMQKGMLLRTRKKCKVSKRKKSATPVEKWVLNLKRKPS